MRRLLLASLALVGPACAQLLAGDLALQAEPGRLCRAAIAEAERTHGTPPGLLAAIGRVESGRRDPLTGAFHPWPWTINAEGRGALLDSREAAIARVQAEQGRGVRSIDVGCMQINLLAHPQAFATVEEAFEPRRNADYAARLLRTLFQQTGSWEAAAGRYHSATPEFATRYLTRLAEAIAEEGRAALGTPNPTPLTAARERVANALASVPSAPQPSGQPSAPQPTASAPAAGGAASPWSARIMTAEETRAARQPGPAQPPVAAAARADPPPPSAGGIPLTQPLLAAASTGLPGAAAAPAGSGRGLDAYRAQPVRVLSNTRRF